MPDRSVRRLLGVAPNRHRLSGQPSMRTSTDGVRPTPRSPPRSPPGAPPRRPAVDPSASSTTTASGRLRPPRRVRRGSSPSWTSSTGSTRPPPTSSAGLQPHRRRGLCRHGGGRHPSRPLGRTVGPEPGAVGLPGIPLRSPWPHSPPGTRLSGAVSLRPAERLRWVAETMAPVSRRPGGERGGSSGDGQQDAATGQDAVDRGCRDPR